MRRTLRKTMMCQCGWVMDRLELELIRFDFSCPRCFASHTTFVSTTLFGDDYELEVIDGGKQDS